MLIELACLLIGGALSGLLAGLLGIGGGLVVIPFLAFALPYAGFPENNLMQVAVTTSLANIVVTSLMSIYSHHRRQGVLWPLFRRLLPAIIIGAISGGLLAIILSGDTLEIIFGFFAFFIAYRLLQKPQALATTKPFPNGIKLQSAFFGIASFCSLMGMGGGSLTVPYLSYYGIPMRNAIGTSAACGFPIALFGLITLMLTSMHTVSPQPYMTGYLYWPAFLTMSAASVACTPIGAKLTHTLPVATLRRIFGGFLVIVGVSMLYKGLG